MVKPANGAIHCRPGELAEPATTTMQRSGAPLGVDRLDGAPDARRFLADGDVDADDVAALLVDDGVDGDRGLADGAVADDQFALAAPEREQRVDDDQAGLHRLGHQIAVDDLRRRPLDRLARVGRDRSLAVERPAERIDDAAEQARARPGTRTTSPMPAHRVAGFDRIGVVQQNAADRDRAPAPGRSRTGPCRSAASSSSRTSGSPETSAMPSPTSSTRPICSARGPSLAASSLARACSSQRSGR